jgi:hypothetical protein
MTRFPLWAALKTVLAPSPKCNGMSGIGLELAPDARRRSATRYGGLGPESATAAQGGP